MHQISTGLVIQNAKFGDDAAGAGNVYPSTYIDATMLLCFAFVGIMKNGDTPVVKVVQAQDAVGTNKKDLSAELTVTATADGQKFVIEGKTETLDADGWTHIGLEFVSGDVTGSVTFYGMPRNFPIDVYAAEQVVIG